jgi:hypothetical protein
VLYTCCRSTLVNARRPHLKHQTLKQRAPPSRSLRLSNAGIQQRFTTYSHSYIRLSAAMSTECEDDLETLQDYVMARTRCTRIPPRNSRGLGKMDDGEKKMRAMILMKDNGSTRKGLFLYAGAVYWTRNCARPCSMVLMSIRVTSRFGSSAKTWSSATSLCSPWL